MAEIKIYRAAYVYHNTDTAGINFSPWVQSEGIDEALAALPGPGDTEGIVIGWEEKILDTEPV